MKPLPTQEYLNECFNYDYETGLLYWKRRPLKHFKSDKAYNIWNARFAGKLALNCVGKRGYKYGSLCGETAFAHRVIYKLIIGIEENNILHSDGNTGDNRIESLSVGTHSENMKDKAISKINFSGITGVCWHAQSGKWCAYIHADGKRKHLGLFEKKEKATAVRKAAEVQYGYHPNHGTR